MMEVLSDLPPELWVLPPLAIAAGIDLYLTLLFLGAMPTTSWWSTPLPGALSDLDSLGVMLMAGGFYLMEFAAERFPTASLVWNAFHTVIRPLSGALLALLLLDGHPPALLAGAAVFAGALASASHAVRSGASILRWLSSARTPHPLIASLGEDAVVLAIVALSIDQPVWALGVGIVLSIGGAIGGASRVRAFMFAVRLAAGRAFQNLGARRWTNKEDFPRWVHRSLAGIVTAPGVGLRGSPVGAHRLPGAPLFVPGWIVVRGDRPIFVFHKRRGAGLVELGSLGAVEVEERGFFRRVEFVRPDEGPASIFFALDGPSAESLRAEFMFA